MKRARIHPRLAREVEDLRDLPSIAGLRRLTRSLAMLDAILSLEWDYRYYSFDSTLERLPAAFPLQPLAVSAPVACFFETHGI